MVSFSSIMLMLYLVSNEAKLQQYPILISSLITTLITLNHLIPLIDSSRDVGTIENGSYVLFNIIVIYAILPVPKHITILLSSLISFINLAILGYFLTNSGLNIYIILKRLTCYAILYFVANVYGVYHQVLTTISQEDSYKNTIKFIDGRMKLEKEKQQQVSSNGMFEIRCKIGEKNVKLMLFFRSCWWWACCRPI